MALEPARRLFGEDPCVLPRRVVASTADPRRLPQDLYSSAKTILDHLTPRLSPGAVLVFDELIHYVEFERGELRALLEFQRSTGRSVRLLALSATRLITNAHVLRKEIQRLGRERHFGLEQAVAMLLL